jgi:hypothetical protein
MANGSISILEAFEELTDPRMRECVHQLNELLLAAICAIISGAESWTSVVEWSEMKLDWLRQYLPFANGIASHDTFGRVEYFPCLTRSSLRPVFCVGPMTCVPG